MTRTNIVLAAAAVIFGAGCFVLLEDMSAQRDRVRALEAQLTQLRLDPMADTASLSIALDTSATPTSDPPAPTASLPPSPAGPEAVTKPVAETNKEWRALLADPAYRQARLAEIRLELQREYPLLATELGLSAHEATRFLDLLAEQALRENEREMKVPGMDPIEWRRDFQARVEQERRAFLGEDRFHAWVEYLKSAEARALVNDLRTQLATTSSPLREEQVRPLVKELASEHQRHAAERQENYQSETRGGEWTEATPAAQQIDYMERRATLIEQSLDRQQEAGEMYLDSVQQHELDAILDRRRQQAQLELQSFRAQVEAAGRAKSRSR